MISNLTSKERRVVAFVAGLVTALVAAAFVTEIAQAQSEGEPAVYPFKLTKNISDNITPDPYTADEFKFEVSGYGVVELDAFTDDTAEKVIYLPAGTYTVEEIGPDGFVPEDWTVQWSGYGCESEDDGNGPIRPIDITVVEAEDPDAGGNVCRADNQWRGEEEPAYAQSSYYSQSEYYSQSTYYSQASYGGGYSQGSYSYSQGAYGGEGQSFLVFGYVWHDENENDEWEQEEPNPEDNENDLSGWTVEITDGEVTFSTTTDPTGYYYFYVPEGTWTINEVVQDGWTKTFPNVNGHVVEVTDGMTAAENESFFAGILNSLVPTAHAQAPITFGPFNFGNFFPGGNQYSQASYGGGSYSQSSYGGGNGRKISLRDGGGSNDDDDDEPTPQVLGESAVLPLGAPAAGGGGTSPLVVELPTLTAILGTRKSDRVAHGK